MRSVKGLVAGAALVLAAACEPATPDEPGPAGVDAGGAAAPMVTAATPIEAGRYIVQVGGCNDCHTEGYAAAMGDIPEERWLTGSIVGFRGPWGTSYPSNLRRTVQAMTEDQWVETFRTRKGLPPMPWMNVAAMAESDARAVYGYLRALGAAGDLAPAPLGPGVEPQTPWIDFVPQNLPATQPAGG